MAQHDMITNELNFQSWYNKMARMNGLNINPDDPQHFYDYRGAYNAYGAQPLEQMLSQSGHWPSEFKKPGNPREILAGVDTKTDLMVPGRSEQFPDYVQNVLDSRYFGTPHIGVKGFK